MRTHGHGLRASEEKARYRSATVTGNIIADSKVKGKCKFNVIADSKVLGKCKIFRVIN
jgi:hypothetical protein